MCLLGRRIFVAVLSVIIPASGCTSSAKLVAESERGGMVSYAYFNDQDILSSQSRRDALRLLEAKCPGGYLVTREGEIPRINRVVDQVWKGQISSDGQVSREKQWAIQFTCKSSNGAN
ncbi:MAG: hypothetical protein OJF52_001641 [Nitrospira sp.]|jgi:hypothetical protein|nr:MAG: hypothetical protein OJF52_001641 [Nitrospira sp.]